MQIYFIALSHENYHLSVGGGILVYRNSPPPPPPLPDVLQLLLFVVKVWEAGGGEGGVPPEWCQVPSIQKECTALPGTPTVGVVALTLLHSVL